MVCKTTPSTQNKELNTSLNDNIYIRLKIKPNSVRIRF